MGETISKKIGSSMKKTMEENGKNMQKSQIENMMKQREMMMAMQLARMKDIFYFYSAFLGILALPLTKLAISKKTPGYLGPFLPLLFIWVYQYDLIYGNKIERIRKEAERILDEEPNKFYLPSNNMLISNQSYNEILKIDERIKKYQKK